MNADIPLAADHYSYFAGCLRAQEVRCSASRGGSLFARPALTQRTLSAFAQGSLTQLDDHTVAYHIYEPLGVVGQISARPSAILTIRSSSDALASQFRGTSRS